MRESPVRDKSYSFALCIVAVARQLQDGKREYVLSRQLLRAGTSIGANVEEATAGQTHKDFTAKMAVASKEARETLYWLRLLTDSDYIAQADAQNLLADCSELIRMLTAIVKTAQQEGSV